MSGRIRVGYPTRLASGTLLTVISAAVPVYAADAYRTLQIVVPPDDATDLQKRNLIQIPRRPGPQADQALVSLSARIEQLDTEITAAKKGGRLNAGELTAFIEARNLAMAEILDGRDHLLNTSGGFPPEAKQKAESYLEAIRQGLSTTTLKENVRTKIEYGVPGGPNTAIRYQSYAASVAKSSEWSTYTPAQLLRLGTYVFEVDVLGSTKACKETVPVLSDPTERKICGWFTP
jgi:hypothetical protein